MVTPSWVKTRIQPIADQRRAPLPGRRCAACRTEVNRGFDIGGPDILTYAEMMRRYTGRRRAAAAPDAPGAAAHPGLSSRGSAWSPRCPPGWPGPWSSRCATRWSAPSTTSREYVPDPPDGLIGFDAGRRPGAAEEPRGATCRPGGRPRPIPGAPSEPLPSDPDWAGGIAVRRRPERRRSTPRPSALWQVIEGIGGETGWYSFPLAWAVRGLMDRLAGGVGLRRGRRDPDRLQSGTHWTAGGWRTSRRASCCGCAPRCGCPAGLAGAVGGRRDGEARTGFQQRASSIRAGSAATPTGGRSRRSTAWSSAAWQRTSPGPPRAAAPGGPPPPRPLGSGKRPRPDRYGAGWPAGPVRGHVLGVPRREGRGTPSRGRWAPAG